ncbi:TPA: hypothetical protein RFU61_005049 [Klebsiella pneumoniae subsp. pneumoniae]|uniref:hypothetical protein n=1 Tax=Klebsiella TaxID=570 RepID=UPI000EF9996D|nr:MULTISPECIES: hypothetical protein [Klebsiella]RLZ83318.1 hypothetical protein EA160_28590 [Klebsiella pneumoniae]HDU5156647.1 hypothetical protein [Klebsiella pneumoniae subsp. pneumoniae]
MHLSSKLRKIENENQLSFRFFFEDEGIKEKVYIPVESNSIVEDHGNKVPNHDYQELDDFIWTDENICTFFYKIMESSFVTVQYHIDQSMVYKIDANGFRYLTPKLKLELDWYCTKQFQIVCHRFGYDPDEIIDFIKSRLLLAIRSRESRQDLIKSLETDNLTFSHPIIGPIKWSDFLDDRYCYTRRSLIIKWSIADRLKLFKKIFDEQMIILENLSENGAWTLNQNTDSYVLKTEAVDYVEWLYSDACKVISHVYGFDYGLLFSTSKAIIKNL